MELSLLQMQSFRILKQLKLDLAPRLNCFVGANGVGKTSILEAVHLLSLGRSFRSRRAHHLIRENDDSLTLYAEGRDDKGAPLRWGVEKNRAGKSQFQFQGNRVSSIWPLAEALPVVLFNADSFELLTGEPKLRLQFLDWGVFHVEHSFAKSWQAYDKALKQRNQALHSGQGTRVWDEVLITAAECVEAARRSYMQAWQPFLETACKESFPEQSISIKYQPGWVSELSFREALQKSEASDRERGFTQVGPHRADIRIKTRGYLARDIFSRGQQKLFVLQMLFSQAALLQERSQKRPIFLLDDLVAELDSQRWGIVWDNLERQGAQALLTGVDQSVWQMAPKSFQQEGLCQELA